MGSSPLARCWTAANCSKDRFARLPLIWSRNAASKGRPEASCSRATISPAIRTLSIPWTRASPLKVEPLVSGAVRLGACGSAATGCRPRDPSAGAGRCCTCAAATPKHKTNTKPTPIHLTVLFITPLLSSEGEEIQVFLLGQGRGSALLLRGDNPEAGDGPRDWPRLYPRR